ncbi:MAG: hypothetical protein KF800_16225 [Lysobacter sp.]|nr:hypothetical protein [Lysobacter sp.]
MTTQQASPVHRVDLTRFAVKRGRGIWTCLLQLPQRTPQEIAENHSNPLGITILQGLLREAPVGASKLTENAQPGQTSLVLCPEYAFGSSDWNEIDQLVRGFPRDIVMIATFGAAPLASLADIEAYANQFGTEFHKGWATNLTGTRPINFGSVWVKNGNSQACVIFGKRYLQQRNEAVDLEVMEFAESTAIQLGDLWLVPLICADALKRTGQDNDPSVVSEIVDFLRVDENAVLITASLLQDKGQATAAWTGAISGLAYMLGAKNAAILVCNVATKAPDNRDGSEQWRNLTGLYFSSHHYENAYKDADGSVFHKGENVFGWSARSWYPQAVLGNMRLPPYATTTGLHAWIENSRLDLVDGLPAYERQPIEEDLLLYCHASGLGSANNQALLTDVRDHINNSNEPKPARLASEFVKGPFFSDSPSSAPLPQGHVSDIKLCLQGANALLASAVKCPGTAEIGWQSHPPRRGQLIINERSVALWVSSLQWQQDMLIQLRNETEALPMSETLTIFGQGRDQGLDEKRWEILCDDRTIASEDEYEPFKDLSTTSIGNRSDFIFVRDIGPLKRLVVDAHEGIAANNQTSFDNVIKACKRN